MRKKIYLVESIIILILSFFVLFIYIANIYTLTNTNKELSRHKYASLGAAFNIELYISEINNLDSITNETNLNESKVYLQNEIFNISNLVLDNAIIKNLNILYENEAIDLYQYNIISKEITNYLEIILARLDDKNSNKKLLQFQHELLIEKMTNIISNIQNSIKDLDVRNKNSMSFTTAIAIICVIVTIIVTITFELRNQKANEYLQGRDLLLDIFTENASQLIVLYDFKGQKIQFESRSMVKSFGSIEKFYEYLSDNDKKSYDNILINGDINKSVSYEYQIKINDLINFYYIKFIPIFNNDELKNICILITDYTEIKKDNLRLSDAIIESRNANQAKREFLSNMSHEIRTPITTIIGLTEIAEANINPENNLEYFKKIKDSSIHLLSLVNDILDFSKIEAGKFSLNNQPFNIINTIKSIENIIAPQCEKKNISLIINNSIQNKSLFGDEAKVKQVIINILSNAMKYSNQGGKIIFDITEESDDKESIITFNISDNGKGMSEDRLKKIFIPYERENYTETIGTGLGLIITRDLVTLMGGTLEISSKLEEGTTVTINIPFLLNLDKDKIIIQKIYDFKDANILVCEDNEINGKIIKEFLTYKNANVTLVENGKKALLRIKKYKYDLILMDIQMPILNGYEATKEIRKLGIDTPIIALTANAFNHDIDEAYQAGVNDYLIKPITMTSLYDKIYDYIKK